MPTSAFSPEGSQGTISIEFFSSQALRTDALEKLHRQSTYFLVGEKGTGKTAYAVYISNSPTDNLLSVHKFIRETDYLKFLSLKKQFNLSLSEYTDIWKVIILLIVSREIYDKLGFLQHVIQYPKFRDINIAIDEYYNKAFSPEILTALQFVENSTMAAELFAKFEPLEAKASSTESLQKTQNHQVFQTSLLYLQRKMEDAIRSLKLPKDFYIFIDGIDIRPSTVPYAEYLDCVKGLTNAIWSLNNDFFFGIKDTHGRIKAILLLRPDIFNSLGMQNRNTKLKDNSVILSWITDYDKHRSSELFLLADRIFLSQQKEKTHPGDCWDHYFPFEAASLDYDRRGITSFIILLRYSYHRPRDILTILDIIGDQYKKNSGRNDSFHYDDLFTSNFKETYGNYLLGEIRDSLSFYYDESEFEIFLKFFEFLEGRRKFTYEQYEASFEDFQRYIQAIGKNTPDFMKSSEEFIQFLYDQNILCFIEQTEDEPFIRWCFRERNANNVSPKVKLGMTYEIHYGLANTLNTGKVFSKKSAQRKNKKVESSTNKADGKTKFKGRIKFVDFTKGFGFIKQDGISADIYFKVKDIEEKSAFRSNDVVYYELEEDSKNKGKLIAVKVQRT